MVFEVCIVVWSSGVLEDGVVQLVGHVDPWQAGHPCEICNLLVAVVARQAHSEHAGIIPCTQNPKAHCPHTSVERFARLPDGLAALFTAPLSFLHFLSTYWQGAGAEAGYGVRSVGPRGYCTLD